MFPIMAGNSASTGYNLTRSLRFRASASAYLSRTPAAAGNRKTFTLSNWVKRGTLGARQSIFDAYAASAGNSLEFQANDTLEFYAWGGASVFDLATTQVFRDPSAWYHVVVAVDTTQATAANRIKLYINGTQVTAFGTATYPSLNADLYINNNIVHNIGRRGDAQFYFDGYLTEVNFIDGQALTPSSFGSTNALTGVWQPARYTGTYGTNGFYLPFTDNSALTTSSNVGLGKDFSGNGNYWTTNNISITAGVTYDSMTDVPTLTSATAANFCVMNPLFKSTRLNGLSDGNLKITGIALGNFYGAYTGTMFAPSGKIYWEVTAIQLYTTNSYFAGGIATNNYLSTETNGAIVACPGGTTAGAGTGMNFYPGNTGSELSLNGSTSSLSASYAVGDVMNFALDAATGKFWIGKNGTWLSSGNPSAGTNQIGTITGGTSYAPWFGCYTDSDVWAINLGQRPFSYTPPTGFVALNCYNLPTSTILQGNKVMDATLFTGAGAAQSIVNAGGFKPDLVWEKNRSNINSWLLYTSSLGVGKYLQTDTAGAEGTLASSLTSFDSTGFSLGNAGGAVNATSNLFVAYQWQAGQGSTSSNTSGSITSTVSVNASAGFSVVTYTGNGVVPGATIGHGLGVAPQFIIVKNRSTGSTDWPVYHKSIGATNWLALDTTQASAANSVIWNDTAPNSSVFSVGYSLYVNAVVNNYVAYCWTPIAGYSAFGSLTGNGSADGPMVYTGFKPRWIMFKRSDSGAYDWVVLDTSRDTYNAAYLRLLPNTSNAEDTGVNPVLDFLSNGFKVRSANNVVNASGGTYIYAAFASNPFRNSLAQ